MSSALIIESFGGANRGRVVAVPLASGETVRQGQTVFEVENHKVTQEVESPGEGILLHALSIGDDIMLDVPIAYVASPGDDVDALRAELAGAKRTATWNELVGAPAPVSGGDRVTIGKATEIATLGNGAGNSMLSMVGARVGAIPRAASTADFFRNKILDLLTYEVGRLLAGKYRRLNAWFDDGRVIGHERVHAGIGFDEGRRLTLYVVEDANTKTLPVLQDEIIDGLMSYVGRDLSPEQVSRATFTISDLSASALMFSLPLLPVRQCIIIAVTRDAEGSYALFVSFDHRVTEGLEVANFLTDLVSRLESYRQLSPVRVEEPRCTSCDKSVGEEVAQFGGRGLLKVLNARMQEEYCCSACWQGWGQ